MFITTPSFEERVPRHIAVPESRYWQAVLLSTHAPWYLLSHTIADAELPSVTQTLAISWELVLKDVIEAIGPEAVVSVRCLVCPDGKEGDWMMRDIIELWSAAYEELPDTGPVLMRFQGEDVLRDSFHEVVDDEFDGRELILSLPLARATFAGS